MARREAPVARVSDPHASDSQKSQADGKERKCHSEFTQGSRRLWDCGGLPPLFPIPWGDKRSCLRTHPRRGRPQTLHSPDMKEPDAYASTMIGEGSAPGFSLRSSVTAALAALRPRSTPLETLLRISSGTSSRAK